MAEADRAMPTDGSSSAAPPSANTCFVVGPVDGAGTEIREHADRLFRHVIEPAANEAGLTNVVRADQISSSGVITNEILNLLIEADAVVADLSYHNANALYELAYRHMVRRPFAHLIRTGESLPFDVGSSRAIIFDPTDWDSAVQAQEQLTETLKVELAKSADEIETPFSVALDLRSLLALDAPDEQPLAEIARAIQRLDQRVSRLSRDVTRLRPGRHSPASRPRSGPGVPLSSVPSWLERTSEGEPEAEASVVLRASELNRLLNPWRGSSTETPDNDGP